VAASENDSTEGDYGLLLHDLLDQNGFVAESVYSLLQGLIALGVDTDDLLPFDQDVLSLVGPRSREARAGFEFFFFSMETSS
jgi:hypothetical protein